MTALCTDGQPLLPAACAIALMPRPASQHAPTALQHLMGPGSPISDVFDECEECARLRVSESTTQAVRIASALAEKRPVCTRRSRTIVVQSVRACLREPACTYDCTLMQFCPVEQMTAAPQVLGGGAIYHMLSLIGRHLKR